MQTRRFTRFPGMTLAVLLTLIGALGLGFDPEAHADGDGCSEATLHGAYGIQLQGTQPAGPNGPTESVIGVVRRVYDGEGHFTQVANVKGSITGIVPDREGSGTYEVAEDCTGVATFEPAPGVVLTEKLVIVNRGLEVFTIASDPPSTWCRRCTRRSACTNCNELRTSGRLLDNRTPFQLEFTENIPGVPLTLSKNVLELSENSLRTSPRAQIQ